MIDAVSCWCTGPVPWLMDKHLRRGAREGRKRSYHVRLGANRKLRTRHKSYSFDAQLGDKEDVQISLLVGITRQSVFFFPPLVPLARVPCHLPCFRAEDAFPNGQELC
jgi:hypothetical protein